MSLDTLENVKTALMVTGTDDDAVLTRLMDSAESFIEEHCGRAFAGGTFTETHSAGGTLLFLANFPIEAVTSLRVDPARAFAAETERAAETFVVHAGRGVVESLTGPFLTPRTMRPSADWPAAVQIEYTTPTDEVPAAVKDAFTQLIGHWYRQVKTSASDGHLMLTEWGDGTNTKAFSWSLTSGLSLPPGVLQLLEPFRVPSV